MSGCQPIVFGTAMLRRVQLQEERNVYSSGAQKQGSISVGAAQHMSLLQSFSRFFNVFAINVSPLRAGFRLSKSAAEHYWLPARSSTNSPGSPRGTSRSDWRTGSPATAGPSRPRSEEHT